MKWSKYLTLLIMLIMCTPVTFAQTGWYWQYPVNSANMVTGICYAGNNTIYYCGQIGWMMKSTNNGASWTHLSTGTTYNLTSIDFVNENTGYACGNYGIVVKTTDGGTTFTQVNIPQASSMFLYSVSFPDINTGYIAASSGQIFKTSNGGLNWTGMSTSTYYPMESLTALSANNVVAVGVNGAVTRTTNGGTNWVSGTTTTGNVLLGVNFADSLNGYAVGLSGTVIKTTDGGSTWDSCHSFTMNVLYAAKFINANTGFVSGIMGGIFKTTNGGNNWQVLPTVIRDNIDCIDANSQYIAAGTFGGNVLLSSNLGESWRLTDTSTVIPMLRGVDFLDQNTGYTVAYPRNMYKTTNGGSNWTLCQPLDTNSIFWGLGFLNANTGAAVSDHGRIFLTTDGGNSFTMKVSGISGSLNTAKFIPGTSIGFACGMCDSIAKTTNAGQTWKGVPLNINDTGHGVILNASPVNQNVIYASGNNSRIYKSTDAGETWTLQMVSTTIRTDLWACGFANENLGYAGGSNGQIFRTTNGGLNWSVTTGMTNQTFFSVCATDSLNAYIIGAAGTVFKTTNSGNNWTQMDPVTQQALYGADFVNSNLGWAVGGGFNGANAVIIKIGTSVTSIDPVITESPSNYQLYQNYPNPFNPTTTIKFAIPGNSFVSLKIFDITGREVANLLNADLKTGSYEVKWDASKNSSGIYFYRIQAGNYTETKKMMLVK